MYAAGHEALIIDSLQPQQLKEEPIQQDTGYFYQELREDKSGYDIVLVKRDYTTTGLRHSFPDQITTVRLNHDVLDRAQKALWM